MDLQLLNAAAAKIGVFPVRVQLAMVEKYEFQKGAQKVEGQTFRCLLVGLNETSYCLGTFRGKKQEIEAAEKKFVNKSTWQLSRVVFDGRMKAEYNSCPLKLVVALNSTVVTPGGDKEASLPAMIKPQYSLADVAAVTSSNLYFDVLGFVTEVTESTVHENREKLVVHLIDDSMKVVSIGVWDDAGKAQSLLEQIRKLEKKVVVMTGIKSSWKDQQLNLNTSKSTMIVLHDSSNLDIGTLKGADTGSLEKLTVTSLRPEVDWTQHASHTCLNVLNHMTAGEGIYQACVKKNVFCFCCKTCCFGGA